MHSDKTGVQRFNEIESSKYILQNRVIPSRTLYNVPDIRFKKYVLYNGYTRHKL